MARFSIPTLIFLTVLAPTATAQTGAVRGFVTEARSEQPLQGASVTLHLGDASIAGTTTDGDGFFRFASIVAGTYRLRITFVGFMPWEESVEVSVGAILTRSVALEEATGEIGELVVEADAASGITAVAAGVETIRPRDVARVPIPGVTGDLAAYLQSVPGVVLAGDRGGRMHVRGGSVEQNLVLVDNIPVYGAFHLLSMFSAFSDDVIDGAELHTGAFAAEHGSRLSSVLDVQTRNGNKQALGASVALATFLSGLRIEGPIVPGRASFIVSGRRSLVEDISPDLFGQTMPFRFGDGFAKAHALLGSGHELSVFGLVTDDEGQLAGSQFDFLGNPVKLPESDSLDLAWDNRVVGAKYTMLPGWLPFRLDLTAGQSRFRSSFGPMADPERSSDINSLDLRADVMAWTFGAEWTAGVLYRRTEFDAVLNEVFRTGTEVISERLTEISAWLSGEWSLPGGVGVIPGLRVVSLDEGAGTVLEPRIRATWNPEALGGSQRFSASWGRVHQAVNGLTDERDVGNPFTIWTRVPGSESLPSSTHTIVGWSGPVAGLVDVAIEGFDKRFEGLQVPVFSALPTFTTRLQGADGKARGVDVRVAIEGRPFVGKSILDARFSYSLAEVTYETVAGEIYPPGHDRRHAFGAVATASRGEVALTVQAQVGSGLPFTPSSGFDQWLLLTPETDVTRDPAQLRVLYGAPNSVRQPSYARFDVWIEKRIDRGRTVATLRAGAMNVLNRANLFYYDLFTFQRVNQLPIVPSVGIRLEVR